MTAVAIESRMIVRNCISQAIDNESSSSIHRRNPSKNAFTCSPIENDAKSFNSPASKNEP